MPRENRLLQEMGEKAAHFGSLFLLPGSTLTIG